jgi:hypothetical protein
VRKIKEVLRLRFEVGFPEREPPLISKNGWNELGSSEPSSIVIRQLTRRAAAARAGRGRESERIPSAIPHAVDSSVASN